MIFSENLVSFRRVVLASSSALVWKSWTLFFSTLLIQMMLRKLLINHTTGSSSEMSTGSERQRICGAVMPGTSEERDLLRSVPALELKLHPKKAWGRSSGT